MANGNPANRSKAAPARPARNGIDRTLDQIEANSGQHSALADRSDDHWSVRASKFVQRNLTGAVNPGQVERATQQNIGMATLQARDAGWQQKAEQLAKIGVVPGKAGYEQAKQAYMRQFVEKAKERGLLPTSPRESAASQAERTQQYQERRNRTNPALAGLNAVDRRITAPLRAGAAGVVAGTAELYNDTFNKDARGVPVKKGKAYQLQVAAKRERDHQRQHANELMSAEGQRDGSLLGDIQANTIDLGDSLLESTSGIVLGAGVGGATAKAGAAGARALGLGVKGQRAAAYTGALAGGVASELPRNRSESKENAIRSYEADPKTGRAAVTNDALRRTTKEFNQFYNQYLASGMTPEAAEAAARADTIEVKAMGTANQAAAAMQVLTMFAPGASAVAARRAAGVGRAAGLGGRAPTAAQAQRAAGRNGLDLSRANNTYVGKNVAGEALEEGAQTAAQNAIVEDARSTYGDVEFDTKALGKDVLSSMAAGAIMGGGARMATEGTVRQEDQRHISGLVEQSAQYQQATAPVIAREKARVEAVEQHIASGGSLTPEQQELHNEAKQQLSNLETGNQAKQALSDLGFNEWGGVVSQQPPARRMPAAPAVAPTLAPRPAPATPQAAPAPAAPAVAPSLVPAAPTVAPTPAAPAVAPSLAPKPASTPAPAAPTAAPSLTPTPAAPLVAPSLAPVPTAPAVAPSLAPAAPTVAPTPVIPSIGLAGVVQRMGLMPSGATPEALAQNQRISQALAAGVPISEAISQAAAPLSISAPTPLTDMTGVTDLAAAVEPDPTVPAAESAQATSLETIASPSADPAKQETQPATEDFSSNPVEQAESPATTLANAVRQAHIAGDVAAKRAAISQAEKAGIPRSQLYGIVNDTVKAVEAEKSGTTGPQVADTAPALKVPEAQTALPDAPTDAAAGSQNEPMQRDEPVQQAASETESQPEITSTPAVSTDIVKADGQPFANRNAANLQRAKRGLKDSHDIIEIAPSQFVIRARSEFEQASNTAPAPVVEESKTTNDPDIKASNDLPAPAQAAAQAAAPAETTEAPASPEPLASPEPVAQPEKATSTDIVKADGKPFANRNAANLQRAKRGLKDSHDIVEVASSQFVIRAKAEAKAQPQTQQTGSFNFDTDAPANWQENLFSARRVISDLNKAGMLTNQDKTAFINTPRQLDDAVKLIKEVQARHTGATPPASAPASESKADAPGISQPTTGSAAVQGTASESKAADAAEATESKNADPFANNTLFTSDKVAAAKERLRKKLSGNQLNSGIDPELLTDGMIVAGAYIESGTCKFADFAKAMIADMGDSVKPYLLSFWEGARNYPGLDTSGMTSPAEAKAEYDRLNQTVPAAVEPIIGDTATPKTKATPKTPADPVLRQDWGVEHLDGYAESAEFSEARQTDYGLSSGVKDAFLRDARAYLTAVANALQAEGYEAVPDRKGKPGKPVSVNESGPATSGDVTLTMTTPDGRVAYASIGVSSLRGMVPATASGVSIMFRTSDERNQWSPTDLPASQLASLIMNREPKQVTRNAAAVEAPSETKESGNQAEQQQRLTNLTKQLNKPNLTAGQRNRLESKITQIEQDIAQSAPEDTTHEPAKLDRGSPAALAGTQAEDVSAVSESRESGSEAETGSGTDVSGSGRAGAAGVSATRSVGDRTREVSDATGRGYRTRSEPAPASGQPDTGAGSVPAGTAGAISQGNTGEGQQHAGTGQSSVTPDSTPAPAQAIPATNQAADFTITDDDAIGEGGAKTKYRQNVEAIRTLRQIQSEDRPATKDEQKILAKWVGWGGLAQAFGRSDGSTAKGWEREAAELKELLTPEEWETAQNSTIAAHYTSPEIVKGMWQALQRMGFTGGRVLEPSVGSGNFLGLTPKTLRGTTRFYGTELDTITGGIAQQLYPKASIKVMGFQDYAIPQGTFKVAIGNPPFSSITITDKANPHLNGLSLHNYFFAKSVDALEPNGVLAMVVTSNFMEASERNDRAKTYIGKQAELLAAIRLPNNAFMKNAGTEVTTDIIFLRKRTPAEIAAGTQTGHKWYATPTYTDSSGKQLPLNEYFHANPDMMLGEWGAYGSMYGPDEPALVAPKGQNTAELLQKAISRLPENVISPPHADDAVLQEKVLQSIPDVKIGSLFESNGAIYQRQPDELGERIAEPVEMPNDKAFERISGMIKMRSLLATVRYMQLQHVHDSETLEQERTKLNQAYDDFVKRHGFINSDPNKRLMRDDPSWPQLSALEEGYNKGISKAVSDRTGEAVKKPSARKADILTKRTQFPATNITSVQSARDGMLESLNQHGTLNLDYIEQLYGKPAEAIVSELGDLIYQDPAMGWQTAEQYLSGNVKAKLAAAREAAETDKTYQRNVAALEAIQPADIEAVDIEVRAGAHWVPEQHIVGFIDHLLETSGSKAIFNRFSSQWTITVRGTGSAAQTAYGTERASAAEVMAAALNHKQITVYDKLSRDTTVVNKEETAAANEKVEAVKRAWADWIWQDDDRRVQLAAIYNETFNTDALTRYDGSHLNLAGKVDDTVITLRPTQKNAIWRITQNPTTLLDHVVGAGKTFTIVAAVMELRRMGLSSKPMIVVPNHLVNQWAREFMMLYPNANILAASKADFEAGKRKKLMARIATGDWDAVIVAHSSFGKVAVSPQFEARFINKQIKELMDAEDQMREKEGKDARTAKDLAKRRLALEEKYKQLSSAEHKDTDNLYFHELGIDSLFVDEAHEFKNLAYVTTMQRVAGLGNQTGSQKAMDLFMKIQQMKENPDSRVVFATGTPISNSMAEMFTMQRYLDLERMERQGIHNFDAWANTFGQIVSDWELSAAGKYKMNSRFAKFVNMPELMQSYLGFADVINRDDINESLKAQGKVLPVPKVASGKPRNVVVPRSDAQAGYIGVPVIRDGVELYPRDCLIYRAENLPKGEDAKVKGADNMLKIMSDARKAALDMRLIDPSESDHEGSKVNQAARNIVEIYHKWHEDKGTQLVFCDLSTPKGAVAAERAKIEQLVRLADQGDEAAEAELSKYSEDDLAALNAGFSVYDDLKSKLIAAGIPAAEVAFIHDAKTDLQKDELFGKVKSGRIRVLLGSTSKMGAGTNVQDRLVALHHLDAPWRPSDLEQREGRIIRQGNELYQRDPEGFEVEIMRYATEQTMDSMQWQIIESKARFIEQVRKGDTAARVVEDIAGEAANAAEMKAASSGNPLILEEMNLRKRVRDMEAEQTRHQREQHRIRDTLKRTHRDIEFLEKHVIHLQRDVEARLPEKFEITLGSRTYRQGEEGAREAAGQTLIKAAKTALSTEQESTIGKYGDFAIIVTPDANWVDKHKVVFTLQSPAGGEHSLSVNAETDSPSGLITRLQNLAKSLPEMLAETRVRLERAIQAIPKLEAQASQWQGAAELDALRAEHQKVLDMLKPKQQSNDAESSNTSPSDIKQASRTSEKPAGQTVSQVRQTLTKRFGNGTIEQLERSGKLRIVDQLSEIPEMSAYSQEAGDIEGYHHGGQTVLIASNLTPETVVPTFLHEAGGHGGFQSMMKPAAYQSVMQQIDRLISTGNPLALAAQERAQVEADPEIQREELLPYLLTETTMVQATQPQRNVVQRLIDQITKAVKAWAFDSLGVQLKLSPADIVAIAERMIKRQAHGRDQQNGIIRYSQRAASVFAGSFTYSDQEIARIGMAIDRLNDSLQTYPEPVQMKMPPALLALDGIRADLAVIDLPLVLDRFTLRKILGKSASKQDDSHGLTLEQVKQLPVELANPLAVFKSATAGGIVVLTRIQMNGKPVIAAIHLEKSRGRYTVNDIASAYGKDNHEQWLKRQVQDGNLIYLNQKESPDLVRLLPLQLREMVHQVKASDQRILTPDDVVKQLATDPVRFSQPGQQSNRLIELRRQAQNQLNRPAYAGNAVREWIGDKLNTMFHLGLEYERKGAPGFRKVFNLVQAKINQVASDAYASIEAAPDLLGRMETWADNRRLLGSLVPGHKGSHGNRKADMKAAATAIFEGTLLDQKVYTDAELVQKFQLTPAQIRIYKEARQAIEVSLDHMSRAVLLRIMMDTGTAHATIQGILTDNLPYGKVVDIARQEMDRLAASPDTAESARLGKKRIKDVIEKRDKLQSEAYAPLMRFGNWHYTVVDDLDQVILHQRFESKRERDMAMRTLKTSGVLKPNMTLKSGRDNPDQYKLMQGVSPDALILFGKEMGMSEDAMYQQYLKMATANHSALRRLIHRKGIAGFSDDLERVTAAFVMSNARHNANLLYGHPIESALKDIKGDPNVPGSSDIAGLAQQQAQRMVEYANDPKEELGSFKQIMFIMNMGLSVAFGLVNMTQPFMQTMPFLSRMHGLKAAGYVLGGLKQAIGTLGGKPIPSAYQADYERARREGHLDPANVWMLQGIERGKSSMGGKYREAFGHAAGLIAQVTETVNRRATLFAALDAAKNMTPEQLAKHGGSAYDYAVQAIQETQGIYNKGNRPRAARGNTGSILMIYKQYSIAYVEQLLRAFRTPQWKGQTDKMRRTAALMLGMMWGLSGTMGLPFAQNAVDVVNAGMAAGKSPIQFEVEMRDHFGDVATDVILYGPANRNGVWDMQGRTSMGKLLPGTAALNPYADKYDVSESATSLLGATGGLVDKTFNAYQLAGQGRFNAALFEMLPRALTSMTQAARMAVTDQQRSKSGNVLATDIKWHEVVVKALDGQPDRIVDIQRKVGLAYDALSIQRTMKEKFRGQILDGMLNDDSEKIDRGWEAVDQWNEVNPRYQIEIDENALDRALEKKQGDYTDRMNIPSEMDWVRDMAAAEE